MFCGLQNIKLQRRAKEFSAKVQNSSNQQDLTGRGRGSGRKNSQLRKNLLMGAYLSFQINVGQFFLPQKTDLVGLGD